jgi:hypothetical protein
LKYLTGKIRMILRNFWLKNINLAKLGDMVIFMVTILGRIVFLATLLLSLCSSLEILGIPNNSEDLQNITSNQTQWEIKIARGDMESSSNTDPDLKKQQFGRVSGDQVIFIPIYDRSRAAPGENVTMGIVALGSTGPIPLKSFNYTIYDRYCFGVYKSYSLTTNDYGVAFFNITSGVPDVICLKYMLDTTFLIDRIVFTNIATLGLAPSISNGTIKLALISMGTNKGYTGSLQLTLEISRGNISGGNWEFPRSINITANFSNGEAIADVRDAIAQLYGSLDDNYVYMVRVSKVADERIYIPFKSLVVVNQSILDRIAHIAYITPWQSINSPNISSPGSVAILVHNPLYKVLSGNITLGISIYNSTFNIIDSRVASVSVSYGSGVIDLGLLMGNIPPDAMQIVIWPIGFIDSSGNPMLLLDPDIMIIRKRTISLEPIEPISGLVIAPVVTYYDGYARFTVYYNGSPLPNADVKLFLPDPSAPVLSGKTDANGTVTFNIAQAYPKARDPTYGYRGFFTYVVITTYGDSTAYGVFSSRYPGAFISMISDIIEDQVPRLNVGVFSPIDQVVFSSYTFSLYARYRIVTDIVVISNDTRSLDLLPKGLTNLKKIYICTSPFTGAYGCVISKKIGSPNFKSEFISNSTVAGQSIDLTSILASSLNISGSYALAGTVLYFNDLLGDYRVEAYTSAVSNGAAVAVQRPFIIASPLRGFIASILVLKDNSFIYDGIHVSVRVEPPLRASFSLRADKIFETVLVNEYVNYTVFITNNANFTDYYTITVSGPGSVNVSVLNISAGSTSAVSLGVGGFTSPGIFTTNLTVTSQLTGSSLYLVFSTISISPVSTISRTVTGSANVSLDRIAVSFNAISPVDITISRLNTTGIPSNVGIPSGGIPDLLFDVRVSNASALTYPIWINISYSSIAISGNEQGMKLYRYNFSSARWEPFRDTGVDTVRKIVWARAYPEELSGVLINPVPGPLPAPLPYLVGGELEIGIGKGIDGGAGMTILDARILLITASAVMLASAAYIYLRRKG